MKAIFSHVENFYEGRFVAGTGPAGLYVISSVDGKELASQQFSFTSDLYAVVVSAIRAFEKWNRIPIRERGQVFFTYPAIMHK